MKPCYDYEDSCSKSISETVNGSHDFTIKGYSLAKGMGPGKYISSDTFTVGGHDWAIYFYPDGKNVEDSSMYVSVFIALASEGTDVRALFELTLLDQSGKGKHKVHSHFDRALESGPYALKYRGSMWGYKRFFRRTTLETSDYIKDDCLAMNCTVGVVRTRVAGPKQYSIPAPPSDMGQDLKYLLESEVGCDIVFQIGDETFKAHKLILAARSPVFRAQFYGLIGNPNMDKVVLQELEPSIFKAMLLYIYSDKLPDVHESTGSTSLCTSTIMVQHLLAAADRFGLDRLKQLCEAKLCEDVSVDTVATTLPLAEQHRCPQLKAICLKFAAANLGDVEKDEKNQTVCEPLETDFLVKWGNRKRFRCLSVRDPEICDPPNGSRIHRKITSRIITTASEKESSLIQPTCLTRNSEAATLQSENWKLESELPEEEDRYYTTRGSLGGLDENGASKENSFEMSTKHRKIKRR